MTDDPVPAPGYFYAAEKLAAEICLDAYEKANRLPNGKLRKKYVPYHVPDYVYTLLKAANAGDEVETKRIMHCIRIGALTLI